MFLNKNYVLANELVQIMGIHIANISMVKQQFQDEPFNDTIISMNNCTFLNKKSRRLPNNISVGLNENKFTDLSNKLPCNFTRFELNVSEKELINSGIVISKQKIGGKDFYEFSQDFVQKVKNKILYTLDKSDTMECMAKGQIDGYIQVSKNKFITWY